MRAETAEQPAPLRSGYTTGSCATATCLAAARLLLSGEHNDAVDIVLPKGKRVQMRLEFCRPFEDGAEAGTIKDAGDDPDVTHGALVYSRVRLIAEPGVRFVAGPGVGTVTRPGLVLNVGEPAINPVPRKMITEHLLQLADESLYVGGFEVTLCVDGGEALALKTMNPRLGILGGLSILGTSGIVRPFSCAAYIASIHQGIDVATTNGFMHVAACTGNASEDTMRRVYNLPEIALIEMGDFVGAVLKHLRKVPCAETEPLRRLRQNKQTGRRAHGPAQPPLQHRPAATGRMGRNHWRRRRVAARRFARPIPVSRPWPWRLPLASPWVTRCVAMRWSLRAAWCRRRFKWRCLPSIVRVESSGMPGHSHEALVVARRRD